MRRLQPKNKIYGELQLRRLQTLDQCLQQVEATCGNDALCSAAKSACVECDVVIKMHQQLIKMKHQLERKRKKEESKQDAKRKEDEMGGKQEGDPEPKAPKDKKKDEKLLTLHSFIETVKHQNRPILQALISSAQATNKKLTVSNETLDPKLDRLKVSHFQALAEEGALEPGHEKCRWIRDAFDVEALASQMDENAQVELRTAIE